MVGEEITQPKVRWQVVRTLWMLLVGLRQLRK